MRYIDLHTHSTCSDGTCTIENLLKKAQAQNLSVFSISDHETVGAYVELAEKRHFFNGTILPGVELTTVYRGEFIELLGYGIDLDAMAKKIRLYYPNRYDKAVREAKINVDTMLKYGVRLSDSFVDAMRYHPESLFDPTHETNRPYLLREIQRYPENACFFKSREEFEKMDRHRFARDYLFHAGSSLYSDQSCFCLSFSDTVKVIHDCGGLAFLAHPLLYAPHFVSYLEDIACSDIDGIECCYGTFTTEQQQFLMDFCLNHGLYQSGGSDFHGLNKRPLNIFGQAGGAPILQTMIEPWFSIIKEQCL